MARQPYTKGFVGQHKRRYGVYIQLSCTLLNGWVLRMVKDILFVLFLEGLLGLFLLFDRLNMGSQLVQEAFDNVSYWIPLLLIIGGVVAFVGLIKVKTPQVRGV